MRVTCPNCGSDEELRSKGLYRRVRRVIDVTDVYYLAAKYMDCRSCKGTFVAWDLRILDQLPEGIRARFPVVLTYKYACDRAVIARCPDPRQQPHSHEEQPAGGPQRGVPAQGDAVPARLRPLQGWPRHVWQQQRGRGVPAAATARAVPLCQVVPGDLRARRLVAIAIPAGSGDLHLRSGPQDRLNQGVQEAASVSMATNVGNERGEVLITVFTESESAHGLEPLARGLVDRYRRAGQPRPLVLYTDKDCCTQDGPSKLVAPFEGWEGKTVRLDIWHFMRRIAVGVISESHPLYGTFMQRISGCIFKWDADDHRLLQQAKRAMLQDAGIASPSESAIRKAITRDELALHCRRRTRGSEATVTAIETLLLALADATNTLGVPLLTDEMTMIWAEQRRHVACLQDPPGVALYSVTGTLRKGTVQLPVLQCACGTTSWRASTSTWRASSRGRPQTRRISRRSCWTASHAGMPSEAGTRWSRRHQGCAHSTSTTSAARWDCHPLRALPHADGIHRRGRHRLPVPADR